MIFRKTIAFIVYMLLSITLQGYAQTEDREYPDFKLIFEVLATNRTIYNEYNDSIFLIRDHDAWVSFFRHRALRNQRIFAANKELIRTVEEYFGQDRKLIPDAAYDELYHGLESYVNNEKCDPFISINFCKILEKYYADCPDSLNYSNQVNQWMASNYNNVFYLGKDSVYLRKAYHYLQLPLDEERSKYPLYYSNLFDSLTSLILPNWLYYGLQTMDEYLNCVKLFDKIVAMDEVKAVTTDADMRYALNIRKNLEENLVRNVYMRDTTMLPKLQADSLINAIVRRNLGASQLSDLSFTRTLLMQVHLKQLTAEEAVETCLKRYRKTRKKVLTSRLSDGQLTEFLKPFLSFYYLLDISDIPENKKRYLVRFTCRDVVAAYNRRKDQQSENNFVSLLNTFVTYPRIIKYLTEDERIRFLKLLNISTQVTTYAHSVHVAAIAKEIMKGVLEYRPDLLVGVLGHDNTGAVKAHKKMFLNYIHDAAIYHDLGKNSIISVVNNDYRPLTEEEYEIIKQHPRLGLQYLDLSSELAKFHDTTLGHHKWYNGKGGYPESFVNTKSPVRILIDIVTLSDCMQAATERVGRNYKDDKTFEMVMQEFRRDAGVRYNPELVEMIGRYPKLARRLANLVVDGWVDIYYHIYSKYFR